MDLSVEMEVDWNWLLNSLKENVRLLGHFFWVECLLMTTGGQAVGMLVVVADAVDRVSLSLVDHRLDPSHDRGLYPFPFLPAFDSFFFFFFSLVP